MPGRRYPPLSAEVAGSVCLLQRGQRCPAGDLERGVSVDRVLADLAAGQDGVVARAQLLALGMTKGRLDQRLRTGRLHAVYRGVYAVGHPAISERGRVRAALMAAGADAAASFRTAIGMLRLTRVVPQTIEVTVTRRGVRSRPGLIVHRTSRELPVTMVGGLRVTAPYRTLQDLRPELSAESFEAICAEALVRNLVTQRELESLAPDAAPTRSELERRFLRLIRQAGLPAPQVNHRDAHSMPDFRWPQHRVLVEVDGWSTHKGRGRFESDRVRDADRTSDGWATLRFTARRIDQRPAWVVARLAGTLGRAAAR